MPVRCYCDVKRRSVAVSRSTMHHDEEGAPLATRANGRRLASFSLRWFKGFDTLDLKDAKALLDELPA